jgi:hypothetical protein
MKYWYEVITLEFVDIDFQEVFDFIKKESNLTDIDDLYYEFIDNMGYYIRSIYKHTDENLVSEDNDNFFDEVQKGWEKFLEEKYDYK